MDRSDLLDTLRSALKALEIRPRGGPSAFTAEQAVTRARAVGLLRTRIGEIERELARERAYPRLVVGSRPPATCAADDEFPLHGDWR